MLFLTNGITLESFRIDWLHAVDLGVGADALDNPLWMIAEKMPAPNQDSRVKLLQTEVNKYYAAHGIKDQSKKIIRLVAFYHCSYARGRSADIDDADRRFLASQCRTFKGSSVVQSPLKLQQSWQHVIKRWQQIP